VTDFDAADDEVKKTVSYSKKTKIEFSQLAQEPLHVMLLKWLGCWLLMTMQIRAK